MFRQFRIERPEAIQVRLKTIAAQIKPGVQIVPVLIYVPDRDMQTILIPFVLLVRGGLEGAGGTVMMHRAKIQPVITRFRLP